MIGIAGLALLAHKLLAAVLAFGLLAVAVLLQVAADNPVLVLVLALLGFAAFTSVLTSVIRKVADATGIKPQQQLYGISLVLTGFSVWAAGGSLPPLIADNPTLTVAGWLTWSVANAAIAAFWYELLLKRIPVLGAPEPLQVG